MLTLPLQDYISVNRDAGTFEVVKLYELSPSAWEGAWFAEIYCDADGNEIEGDEGFLFGNFPIHHTYDLDTGPGVVITKLKSYYSETSIGTDGLDPGITTIFDAALERSSQPIVGTNHEDIVLGSFAGETIKTSGGNDWIDGGNGADKLYGEKGHDTYVVGSGDKVFEKTGQGYDTVLTTVNYTLMAHQEIENFAPVDVSAKTALKLYGNDRSQAIYGNAGANTLEGRGGDDILTGGLGIDRLKGGEGADTFVFDAPTGMGNADHVLDFDPAADTIQLDRSPDSFVRVKGNGTLSAGQFKDITDPHTVVGRDDYILYDRDTGYLYYDANGGGSGQRVVVAILDNRPALTHEDIVMA